MKKLTIFCLTMVGGTFALGQQTILDFEELTLTGSESYFDGSDGSGGFTSQLVSFNNIYQGYWASGFAYSNTTDTVTPGYMNPFSSFAGSGANKSTQYAVFYGTGEIRFGKTVKMDSMKVTNNTYAGLSMRNGDSFAKKFGSTTDANNVDDGTNGEDYFLLRTYALDAQLVKIDSLDFYLADFRFADNSKDYIIQQWANLDLSAFQAVNGLSFALFSSDNGDFGMNTPAYFALDDLSFTTALGVFEQTKTGLVVYPNPAENELFIRLDESVTYRIYNLTGQVVDAGRNEPFTGISIAHLSKGSYTLEISSGGKTAQTRFIK